MPAPPDAFGNAAEASLVALAIAGDEAAFSELVLRRQARVRDLLRRLCGDHALADDLAQRTFVKAWRKLRQLKDPGAFGGWLKAIAVNVWLAEARKVKPPIADDENLIEAVADSTPSPERRAAGALDLERALMQLRPPERLCVALAHGEGLTHPEIAELTDMPLGTVKSHVLRGTEKLRRIFAIETDHD